jgi:hypothetical protein
MAKATPAMITYFVGEDQEPREIHFHTIVSEDHSAQTEITKFPVQSGFEISNHAIRKNRKITIEGMVTNTIIKGTKTEDHIFNKENNSKAAFETLVDLVNSSIVCQVTTNLGIYEPVVFKQIQTKQQLGMTDAIHFVLTGEELQLKDSKNKSAPSTVIFTKLGDAQKAAVIDELRAQGFDPDIAADYAQGSIEAGKDFVIETFNTAGLPMDVTYINNAVDIATGNYNYQVHTTDINTALPGPISSLNLLGITDELVENVAGAVTKATACLVEGAIDVATDEINTHIDTSLGKLRSSAYGAYQEVVQLGGGRVGQAMAGMALDCVIAGGLSVATGTNVESGLPNATAAIQAAAEVGKQRVKAVGNLTSEMVLTKISSPE